MEKEDVQTSDSEILWTLIEIKELLEKFLAKQ